MPRQRSHLAVQGQVQGVGFRPFVYRMARECRLTGYVANNSHGAEIEVEGEPEDVLSFQTRLRSELPPLAVIASLDMRVVSVRSDPTFVIRPSLQDTTQDAGITPDVAICEECLVELMTSSDRRYGYPFINCTNCGPRYSIIQSIPYDRVNTTMRVFKMCPACNREYHNPEDRRFHAQPNACPACGPQVMLLDPSGIPTEGDPIEVAAQMIRAGRIIAIKGIGGFHLACRADSQEAVSALRKRKQRESKPLAVMVADLPTAERCGIVGIEEEALLVGPARPIVLLAKRENSFLAPAVCEGSPWVGVILPYTPLHHVLFAEGLGPLVMTSGNPSDEPLTALNEEAVERLGGIADAFLCHNRDIERRIDDSVAFTYRRTTVPVRRARGYVPQSISVTAEADRPILAVGGELKSTVCILQRDRAVLSEHLGDLQSVITYRHFVGTIRQLSQLVRCKPEVIAHDLHPAYQSTHYAHQQGQRLVGVQHHHAHVASCMADAGLAGPVIGLGCDGTGYGTDGAIWGCEILLADYERFERLGHLRYFSLPGGDAAAKHPWRAGVSLLIETFGSKWRDGLPDGLAEIDPQDVAAVEEVLKVKVNCPPTSSLGRLFDAVAAIMGVCLHNHHEAQAAMMLEELATGGDGDPYPYEMSSTNGSTALDPRPMIAAISRDMGTRTPPATIAARFHQTIAAMLAESAARAAKEHRISHIVLSGGCFLNRRLLDLVVRRIEGHNLVPVWHRRVPPGDGGLSLGQAVVAAAQLRRSQ